MEPFDVQLGRHLAQLREERGLTQEALAELAELSVDTIGSYERAKRFPSRHTMNAVARVLGGERLIASAFSVRDAALPTYEAQTPPLSARAELNEVLNGQPERVVRLVVALARAVVADKAVG